jgi:hypothetical protein
MIRLKPEDWAEIYYALDTKSFVLRRGMYGGDDGPGQTARWIAHLERIKRKIGPDGSTAARKLRTQK